ncbi:hypothetical protein CSC80_09205 [Maribacter sp. 6B07]|uniref:hypothetical protein n=1 Tax=Maribacter sp. 6B07 TaxID=2045442 RepID=UPI000C07A8BE|nr:hypothetical protein [Maribacter sp. 6B07]PHN95485.1 hypothetical protein CSC80_09205 [Maribacter sp. 6B07]
MNKSYLKWQDIRIKQLGYANNLIIALAVAVLGFAINFIQTEDLILSSFQKKLFWVASSLIIISIGLGIFVILNRLEDFKLTAQIARKRDKNERDRIEDDRLKSEKMGKKTWNSFIWQIVTFLVSFLCLLILVLISLKEIII